MVNVSCVIQPESDTLRNVFSFRNDIYWDDDHFHQWYGELHPSDFLIDKLKTRAHAVYPNGSVCIDPKPEFYASFDVSRQMVVICSRFKAGRFPPRYSHSLHLNLSSLESDLLIESFESACRAQHNGMDCISVLNEMRKKKGISSIHRI